MTSLDEPASNLPDLALADVPSTVTGDGRVTVSGEPMTAPLQSAPTSSQPRLPATRLVRAAPPRLGLSAAHGTGPLGGEPVCLPHHHSIDGQVYHAVPGEPECGLDTVIRIGKRTTTPRVIFATFRANGVVPHPLGAERDGDPARMFTSRRRASYATAEALGPEETVAVNPFFGVAEGLCPPLRDGDERDDAQAGKNGTYQEFLDDIVAMSAGRVRRSKLCDLWWPCLFPRDPTSALSYQDGQQIPAPADMAAFFTTVNPDCMAAFNAFVLAAAASPSTTTTSRPTSL